MRYTSWKAPAPSRPHATGLKPHSLVTVSISTPLGRSTMYPCPHHAGSTGIIPTSQLPSTGPAVPPDTNPAPRTLLPSPTVRTSPPHSFFVYLWTASTKAPTCSGVMSGYTPCPRLAIQRRRPKRSTIVFTMASSWSCGGGQRDNMVRTGYRLSNTMVTGRL